MFENGQFQSRMLKKTAHRGCEQYKALLNTVKTLNLTRVSPQEQRTIESLHTLLPHEETSVWRDLVLDDIKRVLTMFQKQPNPATRERLCDTIMEMCQDSLHSRTPWQRAS